MSIRDIAAAVSLIVGLLYGALATAADIRVVNISSFPKVIIEGTIEPGDFASFIKIIKEHKGRIGGINIFSSGGDFYEAMKIGSAMRELELSSQAPMTSRTGQPICDYFGSHPPIDAKNCTCASAGFFIHIGATHRGGTYLAVHRPFFAKGKFGSLSQANAKNAFQALQSSAQTYMEEMGVPKHVQEDVLGTSSDKILVLDEKTVKTYFWGELPYLHEWKRNQCSILSASEIKRSNNYLARTSEANSGARAGLSAIEKNDWSALIKKSQQELKCESTIGKQGRLNAYARYFGAKPTDYGGYSFSKWSDAASYLGKSYDELPNRQELISSSFSGSTYLEIPATSSAPSVSLSDSADKPNVVSRVAISSNTDPSPEYIRRLVESLENAWGKRTSGNGKTEWQWNKNNFVAKVFYEPVSATGPFLGLIIDSKM